MLVLDANILIRAVLGSRVRVLLYQHASVAEFNAPDTAFREARENLPDILRRRKAPVAPGLEALELLAPLVHTVQPVTYLPFEALARQRIDRRDADDWPVLAAAMALDCPIWTEDTDFFGCGVATWTSDRVELYLERSEP